MSGAARTSLIVPALFTVIVAALLCGLGVWQLERLTWKESLIAHVEARAKGAPRPLPPEADWVHLMPDEYDYTHVALEGTFDLEKQVLVFRGGSGRAADFGAGYLVLTPLRLASGAIVVVNRGFVLQDRKADAQQFAGPSGAPIRVSGLMRPPESRNLFTPADHPETGDYFTRDPALVAAHFHLARVAPFSVDVDPTPPGQWPIGGTTVIAFPNNHLSYALTWFGLAIGLIGVFAAYAGRSLGWFGRHDEPPLATSPPDRR